MASLRILKERARRRAGPADDRRARIRRLRLVPAVILACLGMLAVASCVPAMPGGGGPVATTPPPGPAADLSQRLTGGNGVYLGTAVSQDLGAVGYTQDEFAAAGTATDYKAAGTLSGDGLWTFQPNTTAAYRTRVLVRRPADASKFSGNVIVEWLNVSGGVDAAPEWDNMSEEITRSGDVWVGVSAQQVGVIGGQVLVQAPGPGSDQAGKGLKTIDPARYGSLTHPGDGYSFDMFTQVARAVRAGAGLGGLTPRHVLAAGESQSAFAMVTYYNGVQPLTDEFDGFFVHSRGAAGLPLVDPGKSADLSSALIGGTTTTFRTDVPAPVMDIQTESDLTSILGSAKARQPDSDKFRLWEVAGTAHADAHLLGATAASIDCGVPINNGPMHVVAKAALHALTTWVNTGQVPVTAPRITTSDGLFPSVSRNSDGIAVGGVRTPPVDVPVEVLSGDPGPNLSAICLLLGSTKPLSAARIAQLYPGGVADYQQRYNASADAAIRAGFVLPADRAALLAYAEPARVTG
ncbi:alpha/beta hydrolase domain-containing protein [Pseudofrankia inefficax]|uniref:Putative signal peptide-containing protein n=1 Tax=Pseudofrankia inefficax (strain DSM 45817 / CECT 9037 / DDB 130130 / EuI1c) TaxID=298654 RepID=E3IVT1_PSEI1|nr:putative signal peptide-containing protein [Pseudofrankia inefficax]